MTSSTTAMNNVNKVQANPSNTKGKAKESTPEVQFDALFSSALGQLSAQTQLGQQENALRESLLKNNANEEAEKPKAPSPNPVAEAAMVWAQRDWAADNKPLNMAQQTASAPTKPSEASQANSPAAPTPGVQSKPLEDSKPLEQPKASSKPAQKAEEANASTPTEQTDEASKTEISPATQTQTAPPVKAELNTSTQAMGTSKSTDPLLTSAQTVQSAENKGPAPTNANPAPAAEPLLQNTAAQPSDQAAPRKPIASSTQDSNTGLPSVANTARAESNAQAGVGNIGSAPPANPVVAQVAAQLAQQNPKAANSEAELMPLRVGDKVLANRSAALSNPAALVGGIPGQTNTAPAAAQTQIRTPVHQPGFAKELGNTVQWAIGKNLSTVDIRVNPESFGPMNMRLVQQGQQVQLIIRTQDETSANLLQQALGGLKDVMAQNGLQLNQVQVHHQNATPSGQHQGFTAQQEFGQSAQGQQQGHKQGRGHSSEDGTAAQMGTAPGNNTPKGRLDLFA